MGTRKHEKQKNVGEGGEVGTLRVEVVNNKDDRLEGVVESKGKVKEEVGCVLFRSSIKPKVRLLRSIMIRIMCVTLRKWVLCFQPIRIKVHIFR